MKEELEKQSLCSVTVHESKIVWMKPGKEILVNGKMFDIKSSETSKGYTTFTGLYDEEETLLNRLLDETWKRKSTDQNNNIITHLFHLLKGFFNEKNSLENNLLAETNSYRELPATKLTSSFIPLITPPPQSDYYNNTIKSI